MPIAVPDILRDHPLAARYAAMQQNEIQTPISDADLVDVEGFCVMLSKYEPLAISAAAVRFRRNCWLDGLYTGAQIVRGLREAQNEVDLMRDEIDAIQQRVDDDRTTILTLNANRARGAIQTTLTIVPIAGAQPAPAPAGTTLTTWVGIQRMVRPTLVGYLTFYGIAFDPNWAVGHLRQLLWLALGGNATAFIVV
nr:uncharacterized protein CI109_006156 [Kwoniella shandongensis]KAA5525465.1 hypothetical protein CI109_006156 [Kwoniella shandongensis]